MADLSDAAAWLRYARSDLALATGVLPGGVLLEHLLFHAQQAAEKALKALLVHHGREVPRIHDIARLLDLVREVLLVPSALDDAGLLTLYAVDLRYPADLGEATPDEADEARRLATEVVVWAERCIAAAPPALSGQSDQ